MKKVQSIFVADDDIGMREYVVDVLKKEGYTVWEYDPDNPQEELLQKSYDIVILDIVMPEINGFDLRKKMLRYSSSAQFIMMTAFPTNENCSQTLEIGAFTFLIKPFLADHLRCAVNGAINKREAFMQENNYRSHIADDSMCLIGKSEHLCSVKQQVDAVAPLEIPVLVTGESGTGKELVAKSIHEKSNRSNESCIAVNCGGLSSTLIESELFGHMQGSFTGATKTKHGLFEAAEGGTLFLDEIGELPFELQSKFLRVLDTGEFSRIGETKVRRANVRVISATNQDIACMIKENRFRQDLYFRLRGGMVRLLPLRKRRDDIPVLVYYFLQDGFTITPRAMHTLEKFDWPGNVRELSMMVKMFKGICHDGIVTEESIRHILALHYGTERELSIPTYRDSKAHSLQDFETTYFSNLLREVNGNLTRAAEVAEMSRKNLRDKLKKLDLYGNN